MTTKKIPGIDELGFVKKKVLIHDVYPEGYLVEDIKEITWTLIN